MVGVSQWCVCAYARACVCMRDVLLVGLWVVSFSIYGVCSVVDADVCADVSESILPVALLRVVRAR